MPRARRNVTLIIRVFINEDGTHYGIVSDPGRADGWQATFSAVDELLELLSTHLVSQRSVVPIAASGPSPTSDPTSAQGPASSSVRAAYPDAPGLPAQAHPLDEDTPDLDDN